MLFSKSDSKLPKWIRIPDDEDDVNTSLKRSRRNDILYYLGLILAFFAGLALFVFGLGALVNFTYARHQALSSSQHPPGFISCGDSIAEARAAGCEYEVLSGAWMPPACLDPELNEEFRAIEDWKYYADDQRQVEIPEPLLAEREGEEGAYFTTQRWHVIHCAYQWRKLHRAWEMGRAVELGDHALGDFNHTIHCGTLYTDDVPMQELNTRIVVEFFSC